MLGSSQHLNIIDLTYCVEIKRSFLAMFTLLSHYMAVHIIKSAPKGHFFFTINLSNKQLFQKYQLVIDKLAWHSRLELFLKYVVIFQKALLLL